MNGSLASALYRTKTIIWRENHYMTEKTLHIPSREEFHKSFAGEIYLADFDTDHPNHYRLYAQMKAWRFNDRKQKTNSKLGGK